MPFVIPESWCWTSIGELFEHNTGKALNASNRDGKMMDYITTSNLYWDRFDLSVVKQMLFTEEELWRCTAKKGDLLICEGGDIGRAAIWNYDYDIRIQNHIHRLRGYGGINHRFYYFVFLLYKLSNRIGGKGVAIQGLSSGDLHKLEVPLPPECEQIRLVKTIDKWFKFVDLLEQEQENLHSLAQSTKSKILGLAISGKLVPQDPNDEPAIELLKRINPAFEPCDNSHYENLPQGWELVSLNSIVDIISGVSYAKSDIKENGVRILRGGNIQDGEIICLEDDVFIDQSYSNIVNSVVKGDIVLVASTGSPTLIGKTGYARITYPDTQIGAFLRIIRPKTSEISAYLNLIFNSDFYKNYIRSLAKGTNINNVKNGYIEQLEVALPPIQEQERIVKMVENIFISLDNITAGLL